MLFDHTMHKTTILIIILYCILLDAKLRRCETSLPEMQLHNL